MSGSGQNDIDGVFERIGGFGRAQKKVFFLMNSVVTVIGLHTLTMTFIGREPDWTCGKTNQDKCLQYSIDNGNGCVPEYDPSFTSVVGEWNLICDKESLANLSQSAFFVGAMLGAWLWGTVADRIGRRKVFFASLILSAASGFGYSLSPNYYIFLLFRLLIAVNLAGLILSSFVLSMEIIGTEYRTFAGMVSTGLFSPSFPLLALLAYLIRDWRMLSIVNTLLFFPFLLLWRIIPESPRWLLVQGREEEARAVLSGMASGNGVEMPAGQLKNPVSTKTEPVSALDLFRGPVIRKRTMVLIVAWFSNCMLYYALSMSAGDLGDNRYLSFTISGLVEVPSFIVGYFLLQRFGRRLPHGTFLGGGGVACLAVTVLEWLGASEGAKIVLAMVGKFAIAGSFALIYLYTAELFPTQVRNIGTGVATIGARLGGIFSPIVLLLASYNAGLPMLVLGVLGTLSGLLSLTLPETLNQPMPETLRELENS